MLNTRRLNHLIIFGSIITHSLFLSEETAPGLPKAPKKRGIPLKSEKEAAAGYRKLSKQKVVGSIPPSRIRACQLHRIFQTQPGGLQEDRKYVLLFCRKRLNESAECGQATDLL